MFFAFFACFAFFSFFAYFALFCMFCTFCIFLHIKCKNKIILSKIEVRSRLHGSGTPNIINEKADSRTGPRFLRLFLPLAGLFLLLSFVSESWLSLSCRNTEVPSKLPLTSEVLNRRGAEVSNMQDCS